MTDEEHKKYERVCERLRESMQHKRWFGMDYVILKPETVELVLRILKNIEEEY